MAIQSPETKLKKEEEVIQGTEGEGVVKLTGGAQSLEGTSGTEDVSTDIGMGQAQAPVGGQNVSEQQAYMDVNREKAIKMAQEAGNVIRGDISAAQTGMTDAEKKFQEDVASGTVNIDQDLYETASKALVDQTAPDWQQSYLDDFMGGTYKEATQAQSYEDWVAQNYPETPAGQAVGDQGLVQENFEAPDWMKEGMNPTLADGLRVSTMGGGQTPANQYQSEYDAYLAGYTPDEAISNKQRFQELYNTAYGGPASIQEQEYYMQAMRDLSKAERTRGKIGDATGRQSIIERTYDPAARVTRGTLALDEALLSGYDETMDELTAAALEGGGLQASQEALDRRAAELVKAGMSTTDATKQAMREQFNLTGEEGEIREKTEAIKSKAKTDYEDYLKYIQETYGVKEGVQATTYFDKPQDYLNVQAQNVMSAEDVARMKALEELTGSFGTLTPFEEQAGEYKEYIDPSQDFRLTDFEGKVQSEKEARLAREKAERDRLEQLRLAEEAARQAEEEAAKKAEATAIGTAVGATAGAIVGSIIPGIGTAAGAVVGGAIGGIIGAIFCFDSDSEFLMADGTYKKISEIEIGDVMEEGGKVYSISKHILSSPLYSYPTDDESSYIWVTGKHAVKEKGKWVRVEDSRKASPVYDHEVEFIYSLNNENHIMISHGVVFADYEEVDNAQGLTDTQCLSVLNGGNECIQLM